MTPDDITDATTKACIAAVAVGQVVGWMWWVEIVRPVWVEVGDQPSARSTPSH